MITSNDRTQDPVDRYVATVNTLHDKLGRVMLNQQAVAMSLSRAVAALRSMSGSGRQK